MSILDQFRQHIDNPKADLLGFFLGLTIKEQKSLKNDMVSLSHRARRKPNANGNISKHEQVMICAMKVLSRWDYMEPFQSLPKAYFSNNIHAQFRPKWLQAALNDEWIPNITYAHIAELPAYPDCVMQARAIAYYFIETFTHWGRGDELLRRTEFFDIPVCLDTHIWYIFAEQCRIDTADSDYDGVWTQTFLELAESGHIPRDKLLKECLQSANRNLPQKQTGWCFRLFDALQPSDAELIALQSDLLLALNCTHSKPVNDALKKLKIMANDLNVSDFVSVSVAPLSSTTKAVVTNTLAVFEQVAKAHQSEHEQLAELCDAHHHRTAFPR